ncbi:HCL371Cp [Eremothecium sinecaudum]|uniref:Chromatin modification-related protein n=1 Tax=Eremothecium sinecaudum TaxID=45286 RepID=A0A109UWC8_9SACH|nr:HCL371Cp [Eremothecium sinecaudum]AMD19780.1 HCL371Cp [Eremothecium sinecaudum]
MSNERPQDPSSALEQAIQDVSNLKSEFKFLLEEIRTADLEFYEYKKKYLSKDAQIHKFIKQHGSLVENPKERELVKRIKEDMENGLRLQKEKCIVAYTLLYTVTKHLNKVKSNIDALEEDGMLAPLEEENAEFGNDLSRESSLLSSGTSFGKRKRTMTAGPSSASSSLKKRVRYERGRSVQRDMMGGDLLADDSTGNGANFGDELQHFNDELFSMNQQEEDDKQLYCFCQSVSYGEMVACDGANCKYEWFHYGCVNLQEPPKGQWYCPECRQEMANQKLKKKKRV